MMEVFQAHFFGQDHFLIRTDAGIYPQRMCQKNATDGPLSSTEEVICELCRTVMEQVAGLGDKQSNKGKP